MPLLQDARLLENRAAAAAEGCVNPFDAAPPPAPAAERGGPAGPAGWAGGLAAVFALLLGALGALGRGDLRADPAYLHAARALLVPLLRAAAAPGWPRAALQRLDGAGPAGGPGPALPAAIDALPAAFPSLPEAGALRSALLTPPRLSPPWQAACGARGAALGAALALACPADTPLPPCGSWWGEAAGRAPLGGGGAGAARAAGAHGQAGACREALRAAAAAAAEQPGVLAAPELAAALLAATGSPVRPATAASPAASWAGQGRCRGGCLSGCRLLKRADRRAGRRARTASVAALA